MSGTQVSSFAPANTLFNLPQVYQAAQQYQQGQQTLGQNEIEMAARAAQGLLTMPEEERARAWGPTVQQLQQQGFAKRADPNVYPGEARLKQIALLGTPSEKQAEWQSNLAGNRALLGSTAPATVTTPGTTTPALGTGADTGSAPSQPVEPDALTRAQAVRDGLVKRGLDPDTAIALTASALHESSADPNTGPGDKGASHWLFQWRDSRYDQGRKLYGDAPTLDQQLDYVVYELNTSESAARDAIAAAQGPEAKAAAVSKYYLRPKDVEGEQTRRSATARQLVSQWGGSGQPATTYLGDSLAEPGGVGGQTGQGVRGANPDAVLARLRDPNTTSDTQIRGRNIVLSSGASNNPEHAQLLASQLQTLKDRGAGNVTVLGVGPGVKGADVVNAQLKEIAERNGARFVALPADQMGKDGIHPTKEGYAALQAQVRAAPATAAPGGDQQPVPYKVAGTVVPPPTGTAGAPAGPPTNVLAPGARGAPTTATVTPAPQNRVAPVPAQAQPPVAAAPPQPPRLQTLDADNLTADNRAQLRVLAEQRGMKPAELQQRMQQMGQANVAAQERALADYDRAQTAARAQQGLTIQQQAAEETRRQHQIENERAAAAADLARKTQGVPTGYQRNASGAIEPIPGYEDQIRAENARKSQAAQIQQQQEVRAQAEFDQKMVEAGRLYPGKSADDADKNILLEGSKPEGDPSSVAYRNAYTRQKYKPDNNGNTAVWDMSMFKPPTDAKGAVVDVAPTVTKPAAIAPPEAVKGMLANSEGQIKIVKALDALEAYPAAVGGMNVQLQNDYFLQRRDPQGVAARQAVSALQNHIFHELAGTAQSAAESNRLKPFAPKIEDTYETVLTKLKGLLDVNRETLLQQYRTYGPETSHQRLQVIEEAIIASIPQPAIDDLMKDPKSLSKDFDKIYGKGAAKLVLSNG